MEACKLHAGEQMLVREARVIEVALAVRVCLGLCAGSSCRVQLHMLHMLHMLRMLRVHVIARANRRAVPQDPACVSKHLQALKQRCCS